MKKYKKGFTAPLVLVVVALAIIGSGATYFYVKDKQSTAKVIEQTNSKDEINLTNASQKIIDENVIKKNENLPAKLLISNKSISIVNKEGVTKKLIDADNESILSPMWSPNGKYIIYSRLNFDRDGTIGKFDYGKTGVSLIAVDSSEKRDLIMPGDKAYTDINWSPDSKYISYLVNGGEMVEIRNVETNKVTVTITSAGDSYKRGASPLVWINNNEFSYILDGKLYVGSFSNPQLKLIASDVKNEVFRFEGPVSVDPPSWSFDYRYVVYKNSSSLVIRDSSNQKKIEVGEKIKIEDAEGYGNEEYLNVSQIGWTRDNKYFYTENAYTKYDTNKSLKSVNLPDFNISSYEIPVNKDKSFSVSPDGKYIANYNQSYMFGKTKFYRTDNQKLVCPNLIIGNPVEPNDMLWPINLPSVLIAKKATSKLEEEVGKIVVVDIDECKVLTEISTIDSIEPDSYPSLYAVFSPYNR
jgi:hypothetical protein